MYEIARNYKRIWPYSSSSSFKVIDLGVNGKPICDFILVINSNFSRIATVFEIFTVKDRKLLILPTLSLFDAPSGGTPWDIDIIYTPLKSAFNGLQFRRWHYGSIFIRLAVVASQIRENHAKFRQNFTLHQFKVIQGHRSWCQWKVSDFLLVINCNFSRICYRFRDI